jgi:cell division protein ZapE
MLMRSPLQAYQEAKNQRGFVEDSAQDRAVQALENCFQTLHNSPRKPPQGVYLWGPVGRGKTWLMDIFHQCLQVPARRQHFHHFMQWVHRRLFQLNGNKDPLFILADELAREVKVLCFDELFVSDIGDAMLLGRLFSAMFDAGVVLVATSNQAPAQLYHDGFNRERFLPAIAALESHMQIIEVAGAQDHRLHPGSRAAHYWVNDENALARVFDQLTGTQPSNAQALMLGSRVLPVVQCSPAAVWLEFNALCEQPLGSADYISLCDRFPAILLSNLPRLSDHCRPAKIARGTEDGAQRVAAGDRELPALSRNDDSVRRFIALVDECYDRRTPLYINAAVPLDELYTEGYLGFPFKRTLSRLREMQLQRFHENADGATSTPVTKPPCPHTIG